MGERLKIVFIVGCGRTGTHLLANTINSNPNWSVSIEQSPIFPLTADIAIKSRRHLIPNLISAYKKAITTAHSQGKHFCDKSHPALWMVEDLYKAFPDAIFLYTKRNPYAAVHSMFKHGGVMYWCNNYQKWPTPNPFLGITANNVKQYAQLSDVEKCWLRLQAHDIEANRLLMDSDYPLNMYRINMDNIFNPNTRHTILSKISELLGDKFTFPTIIEGVNENWESASPKLNYPPEMATHKL